MSLAPTSLDAGAQHRSSLDVSAPSTDDPSTVGGPGTPGVESGTLVLDSCHSTWLFDETRNRYRRILKGLSMDPVVATTQWRSYERLELAEGTDAFVVVLNATGTRSVRAWRHVDEGCCNCAEQTAEFSLEDIGRWALTQARNSGVMTDNSPCHA